MLLAVGPDPDLCVAHRQGRAQSCLRPSPTDSDLPRQMIRRSSSGFPKPEHSNISPDASSSQDVATHAVLRSGCDARLRIAKVLYKTTRKYLDGLLPRVASTPDMKSVRYPRRPCISISVTSSAVAPTGLTRHHRVGLPRLPRVRQHNRRDSGLTIDHGSLGEPSVPVSSQGSYRLAACLPFNLWNQPLRTQPNDARQLKARPHRQPVSLWQISPLRLGLKLRNTD